MKIHTFASRSNIAEIKSLLAAGVPVDAEDEDGYSPLVSAVSSPSANVDVVRFLLDSGADPKATVDDSKRSLLELAVVSMNWMTVTHLIEHHGC